MFEQPPPPPSQVWGYREPRSRRKDTRQAQLEAQAERCLDGIPITGPTRVELSVRDELVPIPREDIEGDGPWIVPMHRCRTCYRTKAAVKRRTQKSDKARDIAHRCRKRGRCKVEQLPDGRFTCSCQGWKKARFVDDSHIKRVKEMLGIASGPYFNAKHHVKTIWLYPSGTPLDETRVSRGRDEWPTRVPAIFATLCERLVSQPIKVGRTGLPHKAILYALSKKIYGNKSHKDLKAELINDPYFRRVASNWHTKPPKDDTFSRAFAKPELSNIIRRFIHRLAAPCQDLDEIFLVDSDNVPTMPSANSRDRKFGRGTPSYRSDREMIKRHFGIGDVSSTVYLVEITLDEGIGSGDGAHMPSLQRQGRTVAANIRKTTADKAYSQRRNFREAEKLENELYIRQKANEKRLNADKPWPEMARRNTHAEINEDPYCIRILHRRSKGEGFPASSKLRYPVIRLRSHKNDPVPQYPPGFDPSEEDESGDALSELEEDVIEAILAAAEAEVGPARLNEALMTIAVENARKAVIFEHRFDQRIDFSNPDFRFSGFRNIVEQSVQIEVAPPQLRPSEETESS